MSPFDFYRAALSIETVAKSGKPVATHRGRIKAASILELMTDRSMALNPAERRPLLAAGLIERTPEPSISNAYRLSRAGRAAIAQVKQ